MAAAMVSMIGESAISPKKAARKSSARLMETR